MAKNPPPPRCPRTRTDNHASSCYTTTDGCGKTVHQSHSSSCYYQRGPREGQLKNDCTLHTHNASCKVPVGPLCGGV